MFVWEREIYINLLIQHVNEQKAEKGTKQIYE